MAGGVCGSGAAKPFAYLYLQSGTQVRDRFIQDAIEVVEAAGGKVVFVELTCAENELERRMEDASRKEFGKLASIEQYRSLKASGAFEFPKLPEGLSVDTTNRSPGRQCTVN